jgi:uncharacterized protein (DUF58 family)
VTRAVTLPAPGEPFPAPFVRLLHTLVAAPPSIEYAPEHRLRARGLVLSQSGTFAGHRPYVRGDDLRRLDWSAYARTGALFTKQLEQEERRSAALLLDLSASLLAGEPARRVFAWRIAALLGGLALAQLDGLVVLAPGAGERAVRAFAGPQAIAGLLEHLRALPVVPSTADEAIALLLQRGVPGRVHWLADFAEPRACERPLHAMRRRGIAVTGWLAELAGDREPPAGGHLRVVDPETGDELVVPVDAAFAAELRAQLARLAVQQDRLFAMAGARLVRWRVPAAEDFSTAAYAALVARCSA